jgi:hypothetical protein
MDVAFPDAELGGDGCHAEARRRQSCVSAVLALPFSWRPLYLPSPFALAMPSRWRSSII